MKPIRYLNTLRYLGPRQVAALMLHRARRVFDDPSRLLNYAVPAYPGCTWTPDRDFLPPLQRQSCIDPAAAQMSFLNQSINISWPPDWNRGGLPKLWLYNLHYFEWLWSLGYEEAAAVARDWIDNHAPARAAVGWEPYPTSLRLVNWCAVFFSRHRVQVEQDVPTRDKLWTSIFRQAQWLHERLETHLMGNHLLANAVALVVVGSCFAGTDAQRWYERGMQLLRREIAEQFLDDGGHFERSPMYHSRAVYDLCVLRNLGRKDVREVVEGPLKRAIWAMKLTCHPDGRLALLNDSAWDVYNHPEELERYSSVEGAPPIGPFALPRTGYYGSRSADGSYIICDAGPIGPDYQPGHGHGDILSFEVSLRGHRVIVDSGVFDYEAGEMRDYSRSTRAHNTVEIDGKDQAEFWGVFRVARRGSARDVLFSPKDGGFELSAWHDGYRRLRGGPIHRRMFRWWDNGQLVLTDLLTSNAENRYVSRLHLHPECSVMQLTAGRARVSYPGGTFNVDFQGPGNLSVEESFFCPQFGQRVKNQALAWRGRLIGRVELVSRITHGD